MAWALERYLAPLALVAPPGAVYSYSTFGFNLAAQVLEEAAEGGESFASLVRRLVAEPACLGTLQPDYEWLKLPHRAAGYTADGSGTGSDDVSWKLGGGGWVSSLQDFVRFGQVRESAALVACSHRHLQRYHHHHTPHLSPPHTSFITRL